MKKNILGVITLLFSGSSLFSQDLTRTANWLDDNIHRLDHVSCPTKELYGDFFTINEEGMKLYSQEEDTSCFINWNNIKDVHKTKDYIFVVSNELYNDNPIVLKLFLNDQTNRLHFENGIRYIKESYIAKAN